MSSHLAARRFGAAFLVVLSLSAAAPGGADALPAGGGLISPSGTPLSGVAGQLTSPVPNGPNAADALSSGIGAAGIDLLRIGVLNGAQAALQETATVIGQTTAPRLESTWFSSTYWRVAGLAALLTLPFLFAAAVQALLRSDLTLLLRAAFGYLPMAMIGVSLAAPITMLLLSATDEMSSVIGRAGAGGGAHFLRQAAEMAGLATASGSSFLAIAIGLLTLGAAVALAIEMLVREAAVYVVVLMAPLAFVALVWPARRTWAVRTVELLVALILSKFVIVAVLSLAGAAYGSSGAPSVTRLLSAMALVLLSTFAPWVMLRLLPLTELAAGAAGAIRAELPRLPVGPKEAMDAADGAAAWAERLSHRLRPSVDDSDPAEELERADIGRSQSEGPPASRLTPAESQAATDGASVTPAAEEAELGQERALPSQGSASRPAERLPGLPARWQGDDETIEVALGRTESGDSQEELAPTLAGRSEQVNEISPADVPRALLPPPSDEPLPPSPTGDEGLL